MGGKPRSPSGVVALARRLAKLQELVARQEALAADASAALAKSTAELKETRAALLSAAQGGGTTASAVVSRRAPAAPKVRKRAKRRSAAHWEARQASLVKAMAKGKLYDSAELQAMAGCENEAKHVFKNNVRQPLLDAKKLKKTVADKGNKSPRNVRWTKA